MSRLDELIAELCPNGVIYKRFDEACTLHARIGWQRLTKAEYKVTGDYMLITGTDFTSSNEVNYKSCVYVSKDRYVQDPKIQIKDGDVLITKDGTLGKVAQVNNLPMPATLNGGVFVVRPKDESLLPRYVMHFLLSGHFQKVVEQQKTGSTISHLTQALFSRLLVPVPPLEVQREIVRVLDSFTLLTAELTAELTARKKQYEFYRNRLLHFESDAQIKTIGDLCTVVTGGEPPTDCIKGEISDSTHQYPVWGNGKEVYGYSETYKIDRDAVVISSIGANTGAVYYREAFFTPIIRLKAVMPKDDKLNTRFLFHALSTTEIKSKSSSVPNMNANEIKAIKIPVPSIAVQNKIVSVLDNFDAICTDLNIGLPAEIEARQKQYEYYRDLLLTFAETGSTLLTDRQTDRQTELNAIKLIQYVFGYAMLPLGKVAKMFRGEYITKKSEKTGTIPVILGGQEPAYYIDKYNHDGEIVVVARSGASAGFVSYWNQKIFVTDGFGYEEKSELITTKFLYYVLKNMESELNTMKRGAGVPHVSGEMLNSIELPIPSLKEQKRITDILDRFDTLCNDLSAGLPAEIEARHKQYEYYRDRLLSFKEVN